VGTSDRVGSGEPDANVSSIQPLHRGLVVALTAAGQVVPTARTGCRTDYSPQEAVEAMTVPGFNVELVASEPTSSA
jgi:hypothetical protein